MRAHLLRKAVKAGGEAGPGLRHHLAEDAAGPGEERVGGVELGHPALVQHEEAVAVDDGVQAVGDGQHRALGELAPDRPLDLRVRPDGREGDSLMETFKLN